MTIIRITKKFSFEMAHALQGHDGLCRHIHGHSYTLYVTIRGEPQENNSPKKGMVIDFGDVNKIVKTAIVDRLDHALVLSKDITTEALDKSKELFNKLVIVDYQPTSENMLIDFANVLKQLLPASIELFSLKLNETSSCFAEWFAQDNK